MNRNEIENLIRADLEQFEGSDSMTPYVWNKSVNMMGQLTEQAFARKSCYSYEEVRDFIHGLCHLFFLGSLI